MYNALFQNLACSHSIVQPCYSQLVHVCYQSKNMYLIYICINMLNNVSIDWISGFRLNCNPHLHDTSTIASIVEFMRQNCKQQLNIRACLTLMLCDYFWNFYFKHQNKNYDYPETKTYCNQPEQRYCLYYQFFW